MVVGALIRESFGKGRPGVEEENRKVGSSAGTAILEGAFAEAFSSMTDPRMRRETYPQPFILEPPAGGNAVDLRTFVISTAGRNLCEPAPRKDFSLRSK
jgi:hypothetical protein